LTSFIEFAERVREEAQARIKSELARRSFVERMAFSFLTPLTANLLTNQGDGSIIIHGDGSVLVGSGLSSSPDVTVRADFDTLLHLYSSRSREQFLKAESENRISVEGHTLKGNQAKGKLRELLGG
jgi:hypothetical protein